MLSERPRGVRSPAVPAQAAHADADHVAHHEAQVPRGPPPVDAQDKAGRRRHGTDPRERAVRPRPVATANAVAGRTGGRADGPVAGLLQQAAGGGRQVQDGPGRGHAGHVRRPAGLRDRGGPAGQGAGRRRPGTGRRRRDVRGRRGGAEARTGRLRGQAPGRAHRAGPAEPLGGRPPTLWTARAGVGRARGARPHVPGHPRAGPGRPLHGRSAGRSPRPTAGVRLSDRRRPAGRLDARPVPRLQRASQPQRRPPGRDRPRRDRQPTADVPTARKTPSAVQRRSAGNSAGRYVLGRHTFGRDRFRTSGRRPWRRQ